MIRRQFLATLAATLAAPAVIRTPGLLMPVRRVVLDAASDNSLPLSYPGDDYVSAIGLDLYNPSSDLGTFMMSTGQVISIRTTWEVTSACDVPAWLRNDAAKRFTKFKRMKWKIGVA